MQSRKRRTLSERTKITGCKQERSCNKLQVAKTWVSGRDRASRAWTREPIDTAASELQCQKWGRTKSIGKISLKQPERVPVPQESPSARVGRKPGRTRRPAAISAIGRRREGARRSRSGVRRGSRIFLGAEYAPGGEENATRIARVSSVRWRAPRIHLPLASCIRKFIVLFCCVMSSVIGPSIGWVRFRGWAVRERKIKRS